MIKKISRRNFLISTTAASAGLLIPSSSQAFLFASSFWKNKVSAPGTKWTPVDLGITGNIRAMEGGSGLFLGGSSGFLNRYLLPSYGTTDPITNLTAQQLNAMANYNGSTTGYTESVIVGNAGVLIAVNATYSSTTYVYLKTSNTSSNLNAVAGSFLSLFCAVGDNGVILKIQNSNQASTVVSSGVSNHLYGVACGYDGSDLDCAVVVGATGKILTSGNLNTWTSRTSGTVQNLYGISFYWDYYSTKLYLAVGANGTIIKSSDSVNWTACTTPTTNALYGVYVSADPSTYPHVAVGASGTILTSIDAVTWVQQTSNTTATLRNVIRTYGKYFISGDSGTLLVS